MIRDWNFWFSVITSIIALIALYQSYQQLKTSNKQHLFDKRIENYLIATGLIELYKENKSLIDKQDNSRPLSAIDYIFNLMVNNTYLEDISDVIDNPLEQPYHKKFLIKREELKNISSKTKFLFSGKEASILSDFILRYEELLFSIYQYQIMLKHMDKYSEKFKATIEDSQKGVKEPFQREELFKAFDNLNKVYSMICKEDVIKKIDKQIKLK